MVLCKKCKWLLKNKIETIFVCWAYESSEDMSKALVESDCPCDMYEPMDSNDSE